MVNAAKMIDELQKTLELKGNFQTLSDLTKHVWRIRKGICLILDTLVAGLNGKPLHSSVLTSNYIVLDAVDRFYFIFSGIKVSLLYQSLF